MRTMDMTRPPRTRNRPAAEPRAGTARNHRLTALEGDAHVGERGLASVAPGSTAAVGQMPVAVRVVRVDGEVFRGGFHRIRTERRRQTFVEHLEPLWASRKRGLPAPTPTVRCSRFLEKGRRPSLPPWRT